jgi:ABC-type nitrate/sulfonate/bicarbonate transport system permease component
VTRVKNNWPGILLIVLVLVIWEVLVRSGLIQSPGIPAVSAIFLAWYRDIASGELLGQLLPSLQRMAIGYALSIVIAVPLGLLMGTSKIIHSLLEPITELLRPIPSAAYVPVAILFFGVGDQMKVFVIFFSCMFPVLLNTYGGVKGVDPVLIDTGRTFGNSPASILRKILLPSILPEIFTGMRISLGLALIVVVVAEMIAGNNGIGHFILEKQQFFRVPEMFCGIFTLGIVGYCLNSLFLFMERRILRWRAQPK